MNERRPFGDKVMAFSGDGIFDIVLGLMIVAAGLYLYFDLIAFGAISVVLVVPLVEALKRSVTLPRLRAAEEPDEAGVRAFRGLLIGAVLLGVLVIGGVLIYMWDRNAQTPAWLSRWLTDFMPWTLLAITVVFLAVGTYITRNWRMVAYAVLAAIAVSVAFWFEVALWVSLVILGAIIFAIGLGLIFQFVQTHEVLPPDQRLQLR